MASIRPVALAVPRRAEDMLVFEYHDSTRIRRSTGPLGAGIDFGEIRDDAGTKVMWRPLDSFDARSPLYPAGIVELLRGETRCRR